MKAPAHLRQRRSRRGYTLVELMMALALFTVAVLGIISMQRLTVVSNAHAKNAALAERIAQAWAGQLEMEATTWRASFGAGFLNDDGVWQRPAYVAARKFGAAFDALGNPLSDSSADLAKARYCTHVRMAWLYPTTMSMSGNGVLRAEIRVFWQRSGQDTADATGLCSATQDNTLITKIGNDTDLYSFVYQTVGVRQHSQI